MTRVPVVVLLAAACAPAARSAVDEAAEAARHSAALAVVVVDNRAAAAVEVAYRPAVGAGGEVGVGRVPAGTRAPVAPVPAGEPLLFVVRGLPGGERRLPPLSLEVDGERGLVVSADSAWWEG